jgi:hypothetical protein
VIALARSLLGDTDLPLRVGCCSLSEFTRVHHSGQGDPSWTAERLGDGSHLKDGTSRDWGFEDIETTRGVVSNIRCSLQSFLIKRHRLLKIQVYLEQKPRKMNPQVHRYSFQVIFRSSGEFMLEAVCRLYTGIAYTLSRT